MSSRTTKYTRAVVILALVTGMYGLRAAEFPPRAAASFDNSNCPNTAADAFGWGDPNRADDFGDPGSLNAWKLYDSVGHDGNGRRTPDAMSVADGALTITGDPSGNSGGMAWQPGQLYGRWEICVKAAPAAETYHAVALLWPDAEDWPTGGEVDFMEISDPTRQSVDGFLHFGPHNDQETGHIQLDAAQWHSWAVEWTPDRISMYVDGAPWWETTNAAHIPTRPMHLCLQLDDFGGDTSQGGQMTVDWARQYPPG
jgi:hypothetical protein